MSVEILTPISYGKDRKVFNLKKGECVKDDFFDEITLNNFIERKYIKFSKEDANPKPEGENIEAPLVDITSCTVAEGKEFIDKEIDIVKLEKYLDMENTNETPRSTMVKFIEGRIRELTGYDVRPK